MEYPMICWNWSSHVTKQVKTEWWLYSVWRYLPTFLERIWTRRTWMDEGLNSLNHERWEWTSFTRSCKNTPYMSGDLEPYVKFREYNSVW
jgi:hypothetical protein